MGSVTRFGKHLRVYLIVCEKILKPLLGKIFMFWAYFHFVNGPILKITLAIWSHWVWVKNASFIVSSCVTKHTSCCRTWSRPSSASSTASNIRPGSNPTWRTTSTPCWWRCWPRPPAFSRRTPAWPAKPLDWSSLTALSKKKKISVEKVCQPDTQKLTFGENGSTVFASI